MSRKRSSSRIVACAALTVVAATALSGCNSMRNAMGITKRPPDEFAVVTKAPLVVPPDYNLRPPVSGVSRPQEVRPEVQALQALFPDHVSANPSPAELELLKAAGAANVEPNIRTTVGGEQTDVSERGAAAAKVLYDVDVSSGDEGASIERLDPQSVDEIR